MSEPRDRPARSLSPWPERVALGFVAVSLVLLLVTPLLMTGGTMRIQDRIEEVADPARELVTQVQFELAREMASLRGYLMTGDSAFLARFRTLGESERESLQQLEVLSRSLGLEAERRFLDLQDRSARWHDRAITEAPADLDPAEATGTQPVEQRLYEEALSAATALDQAVLAAERAMRQEIRDRERRRLAITLAMAALALLAAATLVWFGARIRALAREADRRRVEAEAALAELRRTTEARDRLVRGVTHDVKNPLGAADGYAELLELGLRGRLEAPQTETVRSIRKSIRSAVGIIDDLLDLARAERGRLPVILEEVSLNDLVERALALHAGTFEAADVRLASTLPPARLVGRTDARRVEQILSNLLTNAWKYGSSGTRVDVRLEWHPGPPDATFDWGVIRVSDDGDGLPPAELERIFLEFHRLDPDAGPGHGLGLAISRQVARQLGGELTAENGPERGAIFTLRLPVRREASPGPVPAGEH